MGDVTRMLDQLQQADPKVAEELLPLVYDQLRGLAAAKMACEKPGQTLQATSLVHEAWLRLAGSDGHTWKDKAYFFGAAAEAMRRILIENARRKQSLKHGPQPAGGRRAVGLSASVAVQGNAERASPGLTSDDSIALAGLGASGGKRAGRDSIFRCKRT